MTMTPAQREEVEKTLDRYMGEHGLKSTRQRSLIVDVFFEMHGHFSVEEVWGRVRQDNPRVSVATVYRTMKLLAESGQPIPGDKSVASPDPSTENQQMKSLTRWPVTVSYYDRDAKSKDGEQTPDYRISFKMHDNGITRDLVMDYGDFSMTGRLVNLSVFPEPKPCK